MGNHRADTRGTKRANAAATPVGERTAPRRAPGARKAVKARKASRFPAIPTLIGVTALVAAGVGATGVGASGVTEGNVVLSSGSSEMSYGTDAVGFFGASNHRAMAISRDSERQALRDAADQQLQAAAEQESAQRNAELKNLGRAAEARASEIAKNQWVLPTRGYRLTARFGQSSGLWARNHTGLDFAAPTGTPIFAVANGVISETGSDGAYGNKTVQTLKDGTEIWYCHQSSMMVSPGETVTAGQQIGTVGTTGNVTGPHLHLEVRPGGGDPSDPYGALLFHGVTP